MDTLCPLAIYSFVSPMILSVTDPLHSQPTSTHKANAPYYLQNSSIRHICTPAASQLAPHNPDTFFCCCRRSFTTVPKSSLCSRCNSSVHTQHSTDRSFRSINTTSDCTSLRTLRCFTYDLVHQWPDVDNVAIKYAPRLGISVVQGLGQEETTLEG